MGQLIGDVLVQLEVDDTNIYVPRALMQEANTDKITFSLLANAIMQASEMTVSEFQEFKRKWVAKKI